MLKILERNVQNGFGFNIDYILENDVELYIGDWNGEKYTNGFKDEKNTNRCYKPVYVLNGEDYEIIGFEEI